MVVRAPSAIFLVVVRTQCHHILVPRPFVKLARVWGCLSRVLDPSQDVCDMCTTVGLPCCGPSMKGCTNPSRGQPRRAVSNNSGMCCRCKRLQCSVLGCVSFVHPKYAKRRTCKFHGCPKSRAPPTTAKHKLSKLTRPCKRKAATPGTPGSKAKTRHHAKCHVHWCTLRARNKLKLQGESYDDFNLRLWLW